MANSHEDLYGKYGIYGSQVYDFKATGSERPGDYCGKIFISPSKAAPQRSRPYTALAVACILCVALLVSGLMSRAQLVKLSQETFDLRSEIVSLLAEQTRLKIRHEMCFSLDETERYAIEILGMQKPSAEQISYVELEGQSVQDEENNQKREFNLLSIIRAIFPGE